MSGDVLYGYVQDAEAREGSVPMVLDGETCTVLQGETVVSLRGVAFWQTVAWAFPPTAGSLEVAMRFLAAELDEHKARVSDVG